MVIAEVRDIGFVGLFARPDGDEPLPALVAFGGSGGGFGAAAGWAEALAANRFAVLAIAYFALPGLPPLLREIEVEVAERAAAWLFDHAHVRGDTVGVLGASRGSELALLASVLIEGIGPVVAFAPSGIAWSAFGKTGPVDAPAWTFRGNGIPYATRPSASPETGSISSDAPPYRLRPYFELVLRDPRQWAQAEIAVERANAPMLLVSGQDDAMWPSTTMGMRIERRAAERGSPHAVVHLHYPDAGHTAGGVPEQAADTEMKHPITGVTYALGGTAAGNAAARSDSWPRVVEFLRTHA
jgi:dienelactone hydrolase